MSHRHLVAWVSLLAMFLTGCAAPSTGGGQSSSPDAPAARSSDKVLRIALQAAHEPAAGITNYGSAGGFDGLEHFLIFHASLTLYDEKGNLIPRLATKVPSVNDGDWKTFPDGRMETTYKLRDTKWHDGTPLTADDFLFGYKVISDPQVPISKPEWASLVGGVTAPDPKTVVVQWKSLSFQGAGTGTGFIPALPKHHMGALYDSGNIESFTNSPVWYEQWIGLGPYRLTRYERGAFMEGAAFQDYVLGAPKIGRVQIAYIGDANTVVARMLAGDQDIVPMGARMDSSQMLNIRRGWNGAGYTEAASSSTRAVYWQLRDPSLAVADLRIRRGLAHATDREAMAEAMNDGLTPGAHTFIPPNEATYAVLEKRGFMKYPFDPTRALQLFGEAGYAMQAGTIRNAAGEPLRADLSASAQGSNVEEITALSGIWTKQGIAADIVPNTGRGDAFDEFRAKFPGGFMWPGIGSTNPTAPLSSRIPTEQNRWKGNNYGGYSNPAYDALHEKFLGTLDAAGQQQLLADLMAIVAEQVPIMPVFFYGNIVAARDGLTGPRMNASNQTATSWDIERWELR
jgi:peptide/nickel transport system substrate-binding protein